MIPLESAANSRHGQDLSTFDIIFNLDPMVSFIRLRDYPLRATGGAVPVRPPGLRRSRLGAAYPSTRAGMGLNQKAGVLLRRDQPALESSQTVREPSPEASFDLDGTDSINLCITTMPAQRRTKATISSSSLSPPTTQSVTHSPARVSSQPGCRSERQAPHCT